MASQILTRGQLEKISNENLIVSFLALQDNIILQQNDLLQQNRDISKKLLEITSKVDSLTKKNEELTSHISVTQNVLKILQEAFKTMSSKLIELEDNITNWNSTRGGNAWTSQASLTQSHQKA